MAYFSKFPLLYYTPNGLSSPKIATDILRRVAFRNDISDQAQLFFDYNVKDVDTPESVAEKLYDNANLHWIVLLQNNMLNRWLDWPMPQDKFRKFVAAKYGEDNEDKTHHYELLDGTWTNGPIFLEDSTGDRIEDSSTVDILTDDIQTNIGVPLPISNTEYEDRLNEDKRKIKLLDPKYLGDVVAEFNLKIDG